MEKSVQKLGEWLYSTFKFVGKSGLVRTMEFGGVMREEGKDLIIDAAMYIKGLNNDQAKGELGREGLNALKKELQALGQEGGFERVIINYQRSDGSSSMNPGSIGQWIINVND